MPSYRVLGPTPIVPTGAMTGTNTIYSQVFDCRSLEIGTFAPTWTGTPTGTFEVQVSLDYVPNNGAIGAAPLNAGTWNNIAAAPSNPAGSAGNTYIPSFATGCGYIRLSYTNSSGTGVLGGTFFGKTRG